MGQKAQIGGVREPAERGGTKVSDWPSKWEGAGTETLCGAEKRIWSGIRGQSGHSALGSRGPGGGNTDAKKGGMSRIDEEPSECDF